MHSKISAKKKTLLVFILTAMLTLSLSLFAGFGIQSALANENNSVLTCSASSVTLNNDIVLNFCFTGDLTDYDLNSLKATVDHNGKQTEQVVTSNGASYVVSFDGVLPESIGKDVVVTVTACKTGSDVAEEIGTATDSVKNYCDRVLSSADTSAELRAVVVDLLNYGAEAQKYTNTDTDALVNAGLNGEVGNAYVTETGSDCDLVKNGYEGTVIPWTGAALRLDYKIALVIEFDATDVEESALKVVVDDTEFTVGNEENPIEKNQDGLYQVAYYGISVVQYNDAVTATLYNGENVLGKSLTYSVQSYIKDMAEDATVGNLIKAIYSYGKSAYAFNNLDAINNEAKTVEIATNPTLDEEGKLNAVTVGEYSYQLSIPALTDSVYVLADDGVTFSTASDYVYGERTITATTDKVLTIGSSYNINQIAKGKLNGASYAKGTVTFTVGETALGALTSQNLDLVIDTPQDGSEIASINANGTGSLKFTGAGTLAVNATDVNALVSSVPVTVDGANLTFTSNVTVVNTSSTFTVVSGSVLAETNTVGNTVMLVSDIKIGDINNADEPTFTVKANGGNAITDGGDNDNYAMSLDIVKGTLTLTQKTSGYCGIDLHGTQKDSIIVGKDGKLVVNGENNNAFGKGIVDWQNGGATFRVDGALEINSDIDNIAPQHIELLKTYGTVRINNGILAKNLEVYGNLYITGALIDDAILKVQNLTIGTEDTPATVKLVTDISNVHGVTSYGGSNTVDGAVNYNLINGKLIIKKGGSHTESRHGIVTGFGGTINVGAKFYLRSYTFNEMFNTGDYTKLTINNAGIINRWGTGTYCYGFENYGDGGQFSSTETSKTFFDKITFNKIDNGAFSNDQNQDDISLN